LPGSFEPELKIDDALLLDSFFGNAKDQPHQGIVLLDAKTQQLID
jgi:hypothetical protein